MKKLVNGEVLNRKAEGLDLHEVVITPKGQREKISVFVYAKNRLDAGNFLILHQLWGKQHSVRLCSVGLMK